MRDALDVGWGDPFDLLMYGWLDGVGGPLQIVSVGVPWALVLVEICNLKVVRPLTRPAHDAGWPSTENVQIIKHTSSRRRF